MSEAGRSGALWVARRYYIQGDYIMPVIGSDLDEYDPFKAKPTGGPPFMERIGQSPPPTVGELVREREGNRLHLELAALDIDEPRAVEEFVSRWGLLGLFYDPLLQIRYGDEERGIVWQAPELAFEDASPEKLRELELAGEGRVLVSLLGRYTRYQERDLRSYAEPYFSMLNKPLAPVLHSRERWDRMAEPLTEFKNAVREFQGIFAACAAWTADGRRSYPDGLLWAVLRHHTELVLELPRREQDAGPLPKGRGGLWVRDWTCPSLLAAAYAMLKDDLIANRNLRYCGNERCRKPFIGDRTDQLFCSIRCLKAQKTRQYRRRA